MARSKYNVDKDIEKRMHDGIVFDSVMEMKYFRDVVLPGVESGDIIRYELQKKYVLINGFQRNGKKVLPITYVADFYIQYADGSEVVIDIKGCPDTVAKIKRKLFWHKYPETDYQWITYVKKFGGWGDYDTFSKLRKEAKRAVKAAKAHTVPDDTDDNLLEDFREQGGFNNVKI